MDQKKLAHMALDALEEVLELSDDQKVQRTRAITVCLAYLFSIGRGNRWPFDDYWKALNCEDGKMRSSDLNRCLNAIYIHVGITRTNEMMFRHGILRGEKTASVD